MIPPVPGGQNPAFTVKISEIDLAALRPRAALSNNDDQFVVAKCVDVEIGDKLWIFDGPASPRQHDIELAFAQLLRERQRVDGVHLQDDARILRCKFLEDRLQDRGGDGFRTPDPYFANCWIGEEFKLLDPLPEFVERRHAAPFERRAARGHVDAAWPAIQQLHAKSMLQVCNDLRYGRLRDSQLLCGFRHAAETYDRREHVEIAQTDTAADLALPIDLLCHRKSPMLI